MDPKDLKYLMIRIKVIRVGSHLLQPFHSKDLTKVAILHDQKHHRRLFITFLRKNMFRTSTSIRDLPHLTNAEKRTLKNRIFASFDEVAKLCKISNDTYKLWRMANFVIIF